MTWLLAISLALCAFALGALVFRVDRRGWTSMGAALLFGLAGYALQASPNLPGAPKAPRSEPEGEEGWALVDARKELFAEGDRSGNEKLLVADAMARNGQYANAAALLRGAVEDDPQDGEAWLALGNALVEHTGGILTQPALLAFRRASQVEKGGLGPGYFLGLALIRNGRLLEGRQIWAEALAGAPEDAAGRAVMEERLARLDALLVQIEAANSPAEGQK
ncbi:cytochrome c-type biogenesis protein CcmH [Altererythrobacter atlanticus]|uniref:Uncharacterized protein n=1 Tax=Croceibacterium atlanticum TaxID=1267766 RepID=A0A0F7KSZ0_9SPHN|nr:tetratricopeptide repeat protein [Croceibacterium atlanticum]AKH41870.1 hypothetical protein WYH_00817 [Croceibacterium atlanticum]MBB5733567.1 cytochrome c-type biogenesis protein CcmH [Croceibacterium atlanticum]